MHKRCRKGTESQPVALGLYLKDLHLAEDLRYLHNARQAGEPCGGRGWGKGQGGGSGQRGGGDGQLGRVTGDEQAGGPCAVHRPYITQAACLLQPLHIADGCSLPCAAVPAVPLRQSVADLLAAVIPNDLLRYHLPVLGVTSTTPIMYLFGYCGGVGRHVGEWPHCNAQRQGPAGGARGGGDPAVVAAHTMWLPALLGTTALACADCAPCCPHSQRTLGCSS